MMRITNSMMTTNTKNNININKLNEDSINTQVATGQKISRPSDDPVIAIRALRLNTNLSQLNQYYDKNIQDAEAWLKTTETALAQTDVIYDNIIKNLTTGASDDNTASDRQKILESLKGLKNEFYATGNADYADRTVFTGYRTGESLTFLTTDNDLDSNYQMIEPLQEDDFKDYTYITSGATEADIQSLDVTRIRLAYSGLNQKDGDVIKISSAKKGSAPVEVDTTVVSIQGKTQAQIDQMYKECADGTGGPYLIKETGEIIAKKGSMDALIANKGDMTITYNKNTWESGDLRPEHYFSCIKDEKKPDGTIEKVHYNYDVDKSGATPVYTPNFKEQNIQIEIAFNQKITINTHASDAYKHDIGRDIDDFLKVTQDVVDAEDKVETLKSDLAKATTEADKEAIQISLDAANKELAYKKDKMQKTFSNGLNIFRDYSDKNNVAFANIGSVEQRLEVTKERVADQLQSFKELADDNININLTDAAIDLSNAGLALQAAQMAAGKIAKQTLLDYI